jgi:hypothetical protein
MFSVEFVCKYFATRAAAMSAADSPAATVSALAATVVSVDSELPPHAVSADGGAEEEFEGVFHYETQSLVAANHLAPPPLVSNAIV